MAFRTISQAEYPLIAPIVKAAVEAEEFITLPHDAPDEDCIAYFFGGVKGSEVWIYEEDSMVLGCYYQRPNHYQLGGHVANGGYLVSPNARGKGVGRKLGEHSIARATEQGYHALQFNFVVSTNEVAVTLWKSLGFAIIGTIPQGYHRKQTDYVDAYIMHRSLG